MLKPQRFEVYLINLDPTEGSEIRKVRPCVIVSPNELNNMLNTVIIAPLTHTHKDYPSRVDSFFNSTLGQICLDQIRTVDLKRLGRKLGDIDKKFHLEICSVLVQMFEH